MVKKGDTLVEVTLAIGIFSMIAIAVASVMSGGTASAQLALETTLAREEIDTQAEAIRFIHANYIANRDNPSHPYVKLWKSITDKSINIQEYEGNKEKIKSVLQYTPSSCSELYDDNSEAYKNAFVINPRKFNALNADIGTNKTDNKLEDVLINQKNLFTTASTYPRLLFDENNAKLADDNFPTDLISAEGIYVVPVKDPQSTLVVDDIAEGSNSAEDRISAYVDFYIRTCWYGSRTDDPSTISTVIRLHDPSDIKSKYYSFNANLYNTANATTDAATQSTKLDGPIKTRQLSFNKYRPTRDGHALIGWCDQPTTKDRTNDVCNGNIYRTSDKFTSEVGNQTLNFYTIWREHFWVDVNMIIDGNRKNSGDDRFKFKAYIGEEVITCVPPSYWSTYYYEICVEPHASDEELKDFYREIPDDEAVKFVFSKPDNYTLNNNDPICSQKLTEYSNCKVEYNSDSKEYTVTIRVNSNARAKDPDSSGHNSLQIEPKWVKSS